jgi:hypothetical protein
VYDACSDCVVFLSLARFGESFHAYTRFIRFIKNNPMLFLGVCVEFLIGKQKKPILFKVTEPSSVPYRAPSACAKWRRTWTPHP